MCSRFVETTKDVYDPRLPFATPELGHKPSANVCESSDYSGSLEPASLSPKAHDLMSVFLIGHL